MPRFLNTQGLSEWMSIIIDATERELVIITPYLQLSNKILQKLTEANKRGVEIIFIYREKKIKDLEKNKLLTLDNLNLMHHPNIHAKCMYNENFLLIGSMNLYEYSEKNNREMGILFHRINIGDYGNADGDSVFDDALEEIIEIKNGAEIERPSRETVEDKFEFEILKNNSDKTQEYAKLINDVFIHKKFIVNENSHFLCKSYMDKVDVLMNQRTEFILKFDDDKLNQFYRNHKNNINNMEYSFSGFKFYWNEPEKIYLYDDSKHIIWNNIDKKEAGIRTRKKGIDEVIQFIKTEVLPNNKTYEILSEAPNIVSEKTNLKLSEKTKNNKLETIISTKEIVVEDQYPLLSPSEIEKVKNHFQKKFPQIKINSTASYVYCKMLFPFGDVMFREGLEIRFVNVNNSDSIINILNELNFESNHYKYERKMISKKTNQSPCFIFEPQGVTEVQKLIYDYIFITKTILENTKNIKLQKKII